MKRAGLAAAAVLAACTSASAAAQSAATATGQNTATGSDSFAQQVAVANQTDFQLGQLATIRGHSARVRQYGQKMIDDHRTALDRFIKGDAVALPLEIDARHRKLEEELSSLSGREFDRRFIDAMVEDHEAMAAMLRQHAGDAGRGTAMARATRDTDHTASTSGARDTSGAVGTAGSTRTSESGAGAAGSTGERMGAVGTSGERGAATSDAWVASELRTVEGHLAEAKRLQRSLGGTSR